MPITIPKIDIPDMSFDKELNELSTRRLQLAQTELAVTEDNITKQKELGGQLSEMSRYLTEEERNSPEIKDTMDGFQESVNQISKHLASGNIGNARYMIRDLRSKLADVQNTSLGRISDAMKTWEARRQQTIDNGLDPQDFDRLNPRDQIFDSAVRNVPRSVIAVPNVDLLRNAVEIMEHSNTNQNVQNVVDKESGTTTSSDAGSNFRLRVANVESGNNPNVKNSDQGAVGKYQVTQDFLTDANKLLGTSYTLDDMHDSAKNEQVTIAMHENYKQRFRKEYNREITERELAMAHFGGYGAWNNPSIRDKKLDENGNLVPNISREEYADMVTGSGSVTHSAKSTVTEHNMSRDDLYRAMRIQNPYFFSVYGGIKKIVGEDKLGRELYLTKNGKQTTNPDEGISEADARAYEAIDLAQRNYGKTTATENSDVTNTKTPKPNPKVNNNSMSVSSQIGGSKGELPTYTDVWNMTNRSYKDNGVTVPGLQQQYDIALKDWKEIENDSNIEQDARNVKYNRMIVTRDALNNANEELRYATHYAHKQMTSKEMELLKEFNFDPHIALAYINELGHRNTYASRNKKYNDFLSAHRKLIDLRNGAFAQLQETSGNISLVNEFTPKGKTDSADYLINRLSLYQNTMTVSKNDLESKAEISSIMPTENNLVIKFRSGRTYNLPKTERDNYLLFIMKGSYSPEDKVVAISHMYPLASDLTKMLRNLKSSFTENTNDVLFRTAHFYGHEVKLRKTKNGSIFLHVDGQQIPIQDVNNPELSIIGTVAHAVGKPIPYINYQPN